VTYIRKGMLNWKHSKGKRLKKQGTAPER